MPLLSAQEGFGIYREWGREGLLCTTEDIDSYLSAAAALLQHHCNWTVQTTQRKLLIVTAPFSYPWLSGWTNNTYSDVCTAALSSCTIEDQTTWWNPNHWIVLQCCNENPLKLWFSILNAAMPLFSVELNVEFPRCLAVARLLYNYNVTGLIAEPSALWDQSKSLCKAI